MRVWVISDLHVEFGVPFGLKIADRAVSPARPHIRDGGIELYFGPAVLFGYP